MIAAHTSPPPSGSKASTAMLDRFIQTTPRETSEKATVTEQQRQQRQPQSQSPPDLTVTSANFLLSPSVDSGVTSLVSSSTSEAVAASASFSKFLEDSVTHSEGAEQASMVRFRLEEALKTVEAERADKQRLLREMDALQEQGRKEKNVRGAPGARQE